MRYSHFWVFILINIISCNSGSEDGFGKSLQNKSDEEIYRIASELYDQENYEKAIIAFQKCIEQDYRKDSCCFKLGVCYINNGNTQIGIEKLEEALKINPKYFKACYNIGAASYTNKEYQKSIQYYQRAGALEPNRDDIYYGIAASEFVLGQYDKALLNCQIALKLNPQNENAKMLVTRIQMQR